MNAIDGDKLEMILDKILQLSTDLDEKNSAGAIDLLKAIAKCGLLDCIPEPPPATPKPPPAPVAWIWREKSGRVADNTAPRPVFPANGPFYSFNEQAGWFAVTGVSTSPTEAVPTKERKPVLWVWRRTTGVWENSILKGTPPAGKNYISNIQDGWFPLYE